MNREERIRQFAIDMEMFGDYVIEYGVERFDYDKVAIALDKLGYHKTVWHKVAEGDLPQKRGHYYCYYQGLGIDCGQYFNYLEAFWDGVDFCDRQDEMVKVIAWTELPIYEE